MILKVVCQQCGHTGVASVDTVPCVMTCWSCAPAPLSRRPAQPLEARRQRQPALTCCCRGCWSAPWCCSCSSGGDRRGKAAADLGLSNKTVSKARNAGVTAVTPATVTGRDAEPVGSPWARLPGSPPMPSAASSSVPCAYMPIPRQNCSRTSDTQRLALTQWRLSRPSRSCIRRSA